MILLTLECGGNYYINIRIIKYIEELRELEQSGSNPKALANELRDFYASRIRIKRVMSVFFIILLIPLTPIIL